MRFRATRGGAFIATGLVAAVAAAGLPATAGAAAETPPKWVAAPTDQPVTLITGDKVTLHEGGGGEPVVEFAAAPRDTGAVVSYSAYGDEEHYYVIPSDVAGLVPEQLDLALFDVKALAAVGGDSLPVIVQSTEATDAKADAAEWKALDVTPERTLDSIDAVSGELPADGAPELVEAAAEGDDVEKVWLDAPAKALDAISMPQIGAPAAWEAGLDGTGAVVAVLDSGIDTTHPDLDDGVVIAEKDFTGSGTVKDLKGHGTHVASIIAGTGEASGGANRGVASGAKLINARVLDKDGRGATSWIIDGMEWAAAQGADVINMSLGIMGEYTDGKDAGALAIDSISERYDTLVVVAAGNDGTRRESTTVTTPGTADSALTVGAVDENDQLAGFSSVGPRYGNAGVKPDVTAPGAWILAARAAGTRVEDTPLSEKYVYDGGTSMAAPHVAGAAAILKAARPELDGEALKSLLMGTSQPTVGNIWKEGAGKINVPNAIGEPVYAEPGSLSFGVFRSPRVSQMPGAMTLTYTNTQATDLTLHLLTAASGADGAQVPAGTVSLSGDTVTVHAFGTASVDDTVDPRVIEPGFYTGTVTAVGPGFAPVRTVMGWQVEQNLAVLQLSTTQPDGSPSIAAGSGTLYSLDTPWYSQEFNIIGGSAEVRVPPGRYAVLGTLVNSKPGAALIDGVTTFTRDLDLTAIGDHPVLIDGTKAVPLVVDTEKKAQATHIGQTLERTLPGWGFAVRQSADLGVFIHRPGMPDKVNLLVEGELAGEVQLSTSYKLAQPKLDAVVTSGSKTLDIAEDLHYGVLSPELTGKVSAAVVDAGAGTPAELAKAGVKGKIALVEARPQADFYNLLHAQSQAAKDAGAIAVIVYGATDGPYWEDIEFAALGEFGPKPLPTLTLSRDNGLAVLALAKKGAKLTGTGRAYASYEYAFGKTEQAIPSSMSYHLDSTNTASVETEVKGVTPGVPLNEYTVVVTGNSYTGFLDRLEEPVVDRVIHYAADPEVEYLHTASAYAGGTNPLELIPTEFAGPARSFAPGETGSETFLGQVVHGGLKPDPATPGEASVRREGDTLMVDLPYRVDGAGNPQLDGPDAGTDNRFQLWEDGTLLATAPYPSGWIDLPGDEHTYRMKLESSRYERWWTQSTEVSSEWTFRSSTTPGMTALPLLQLDYGVQDLSEYNVASAKKVTLTPTVSYQDGSTGATIQGLKLWASYDGGATWTTVPVKGTAGAYSATIAPPKGSTKISLKSEAWDSAGATFKETVLDAIALK